MGKLKIYGINGVVERTLAAKLGKVSFNITFSGGIMDASGIRPATFTAKNALEQFAVENHPMFKSGSIKLIKEIGEEPEKDTAKKYTIEVEEVTTMQQARQYLVEHGAPMERLQNKAAIQAYAAEKNITFPNW